MVAIDGWEQLPGWQRLALRVILRQHHLGLVVTTHKERGLPTVYVTESSPPLTLAIARRMGANVAVKNGASGDPFSVPDQDAFPMGIPPVVVDRLWQEHQGNTREALFSLYDWWRTRVEVPAVPVKSV